MQTLHLSSELSLQPVLDWYADNGYTLFPLRGKIPPKGFSWPKAEYNPFPRPEDFPSGNFGVKLASDDLVIDIDPRNFKDGVNSWAELKKQCQVPTSFAVVTGSGGYHIYLKKPADTVIVGTLRGFPGVEFKTKGQYVVGLGSIHPNTGKPYIPFNKEKTPVAQVSDDLLKLIMRTEIKFERTAGIKDFVTDGQTQKRFIEYLKTAPIAVEGDNGDKTTFSVAAIGHDFGLAPETTLDLMSVYYNPQCQPSWAAEDLKQKVYNAYRYSEGELGNKSPAAVDFPKVEIQTFDPDQRLLHRDQFGQPKKNLHNTTAFFIFKPAPLEGLLGYNCFSHQITFLKEAPWHRSNEGMKFWEDGEAVRCRHWLSTHFKYEPSQDLMHDAALTASRLNSFHPVKDYLGKLHWDGKHRINNWMHNYLGAEDNDYTRAVGVKTLVAAVQRIYEPGCKFDYITVLEGKQGTGKSTAWRILASQEWFNDTPIDISKEWGIIKTLGKWIVEWAEMETHRKSDTAALRSFLSSSTDRIRLPYERVAKDLARQGIFVGSFNPEKDRDIGWLHDTTGNRRYWPVETAKVHDIQNDKLYKVRDQLWAEAMLLFKAKTPIHFEDAKLNYMAEVEQEKRMGKDTWHDAIVFWLALDHNRCRLVVSAEEIFKDCIGGNMSHFSRRESIRISNVMYRLGWEKGAFYNKERRITERGYRRPAIE